MVTQQFLSGFEREFLQEYNCPACSEPITNPVCHDCLGNQIGEWLRFYPNVRKKMIVKIKDYVRQVNNEANTALNCVSCNSKKAALCPYCFTEAVYHLLKKSKIDKMIIMDYLSTFNFDLKHEGYILDAEDEGLY
jgi:hypothetical protein